MIGSGCRYFTVGEALRHWGDEYDGARSIGDAYLAGIIELDTDVFMAWVEEQGK
jgi:hypothetical protein